MTQTGVRITLPLKNKKFLSIAPTLVSSFANPDQVLADGTGGFEIVTPLADTPGYGVNLLPNNAVLIQAQTTAEYRSWEARANPSHDALQRALPYMPLEQRTLKVTTVCMWEVPMTAYW